MSKRKSRTKSMFVDKSDMIFEDEDGNKELLMDSDPEVAYKIVSRSNKLNDVKQNAFKQDNDNNGVRISSRAKKQKNIYDPSEYNGPVHKKKKEAMEIAQIAVVNKKNPILPQKTQSPTKSATKSPMKSPLKAPKAPVQPAKSPAAVVKTTIEVKKKLVLDKVAQTKTEIPGILKATKAEIIGSLKAAKTDVQTVPLPMPMKELSKRVQSRKKSILAHQDTKPLDQVSVKQIATKRDRSSSTSGSSQEFEKASTVEMDATCSGKIPDVKKWTAEDVYAYFIKQDFDKKDIVKIKQEDIDGEALLLLSRDDLKQLNMKVGTFVKMWNRILAFQTGKNDFTQGWK